MTEEQNQISPEVKLVEEQIAKIEAAIAQEGTVPAGAGVTPVTTASMTPESEPMVKTKKEFPWSGVVIWLLIAAILVLGGSWSWTVYQNYQANPRPVATPTPTPVAQEEMATPMPEVMASGGEPVDPASQAAVNCENGGGKLNLVTKPNGTEYGVCVFADNRQCEETAMTRGECPAGGVKITGLETPAQIYCAITGGEVNVGSSTCVRAGVACALEAYYNDTCGS